MDSIIVSNIMRAKNKQSFFALHQIQSKIKEINPNMIVEFHILWDNTNDCNLQEESKWSDLIDSEIENLTSYNFDFFDNYVSEFYEGIDITRFKKWKAIYFILMGHYLRNIKSKDYYLIYDDDIIINCDFKEIYDVLISHTPCLISEPMNASCDKVLFDKLFEIYDEQFAQVYKQQNPEMLGFNAGFQGIDLSIYDDFLSKDGMEILLNLFEYSPVLDENGKEIWGVDRFKIDTQKQSFMGIMNVALSKKPIYILDTTNYYLIPNWGVHPIFGEINHLSELDGWDIALKSRIIHFIGHTHGKGKPIQFMNKVDGYLKSKNYL